MKKEIIQKLTNDFENQVHKQEETEYWLAREIMPLLGYDRWENFANVIQKAVIACTNAGQIESDHFRGVTKMVEMPKGGTKEIDDIMLTRYACYLIAQNGDPRKEQIAFAMNYFAVQTRKFDVRQKLTDTEKQLSGLIYERTGSEKSFAIIQSKGDEALFGGYTTANMKVKLKIPENRALADFLPTITIKAKDFATEITIHNSKDKDLKTEKQITDEHITNNKGVRNLLKERGIIPENLPAEEDIKKLERKLETENKKIGKNTEKLKKSNTEE